MKTVGLILRNVTAFCEMSKTSWQTGKLPVKDDAENHSEGPVIPFGAVVEYRPISARDLSRIHRFGKKVLPGIYLGYELIAGGSWNGFF